MLDGVSDPGNLGTLLRSAVATGVAAVLTLPGTTDPYSPKALRSSMGCVFSIPLLPCTSWDAAVAQLSTTSTTSTTTIYAATMLDDTPSTCHYDVDWTATPAALIIGNEGHGLSDVVRQAVRERKIQSVYVPMVPGAVESLNAGVCGSVIMFEHLRQVQIKATSSVTKKQG